MNIIRIDKNEVGFLTAHGVPYGDMGIVHTIGKKKTYYLTMTDRNTHLHMEYQDMLHVVGT